MKRTLYFSVTLIASLLCFSCSRNSIEAESGYGNSSTLTVELPGTNISVFSKADTRDGVKNFNENLINSVYYYFFREGVTDEPAVVSGRFLGLNLNGEESQNATKTWTLPVSANTVANELFPTGTNHCHMFVIANPPAAATSFLEGTGDNVPTLEELREFQFTSELAGTQNNFVMFCDDEVEVESRTADITFHAVARMKRVASKLSFKVNSVCSYTDTLTNQVWKPLLEGLKVEFYNGMNSSNFSGDFSKLTGMTDDDYFMASSSFGTPTDYRYLEVQQSEIPKGTTPASCETLPAASATSDQYVVCGGKYYTLIHSAISVTPLYSYPMEWDFADQYEPYFIFELPWQTQNGGNTVIRPCYYKLMLGSKSMSSNNWYDLSVTLKVMGSFYKTAPTQEYLYEQYVVLDWNNAFEGDNNNVDAEIKEARYLVLQQTEYVLNNQTKLSIPLVTSHPCKFTVTEAYHTNYKANSGPTKEFVTSAAKDWFHFSGSVLEFEHALNNKLEAGMDCSPYEIDVTVEHDDNPAYNAQFHITQYPSIYIYTQQNSGNKNEVDKYTTSGRSGSLSIGYTRINGDTPNINNANDNSTGSWTFVGGANTSGNNSSTLFTIINVSQFDPESGFIVGDPRDTDVNNLGSWASPSPVSAPALYESASRTISHYYPTIDNGTRDNYIAPSFRVNSANSRRYGNDTYQESKQRCAAYQEDGYPAGRWRLPTLAECMLIKTLTNTGIIPTIFIDSSGNYYHCAGHYFQGNASSVTDYISPGTGHAAAARCVYDEWYWSVVDGAPDHRDSNYDKWRPIDHDITSSTKKDTNDPNKPLTTFVWGDKEIN